MEVTPSPMSYFLKAKNTLGRWLRRTGALSPAPPPTHSPANAPAANKWSRIHSFIEEIGADSENAVGRIRLLGFDAFSDRLAAKGPKTLAKVALLAERMIQEEMAKGDRYLDLGDAQFLIFYAHASAEEIKLRGEAIRQKLFGADEPLDPETESHAGDGRAGHRDQRLRQLFRREEEVERDEF